MRKIISLMLLMCLVCAPVYAYNIEAFDEVDFGAKLDAPDLIKLSKDVSIGAELGVTDLLNDWEDSAYGIVKCTIKWSLIDFTK